MKVDMKLKNPGKYQGFKAGAVGIEPTSTVLETAVLPLNYAPIYPVFQPPNAIITYRRFPCQDQYFKYASVSSLMILLYAFTSSEGS